MPIRRDPIESLLMNRGVAPSIIVAAQEQAERAQIDVVEGLSLSKGIEKPLLTRAIAEQHGLAYLETIDMERVDVDLVRRISLTLARDQGVLPLWIDGEQLHVAIAGPRSLAGLDDLRVLFERPVHGWMVDADTLREATNKAFDKATRSASEVMSEIDDDVGSQEGQSDLKLAEDLIDDPNQAPIIRFVNSLFSESIKDRASDIHIEPFEKELSVRFRIDGVLYEKVKPPPRLQASIVSRIKIMAGLNIAEKRIPQDGRIRTRMAGREIDVRVSSMPVRHGERVVMRLLEKGNVFDLSRVGMGTEIVTKFRKLIHLPHGIILVCGPTGSGKTTTLYSALAEINSPDKNILTIEDPIEYEMRGIGQTQVNPKIDLTFASVLRAHLRQDPDVILVGETRDRETAANAIQASLTGHLVFSTIHTNDSPTAFTRLIDMGIEPFLVSSSLVAILAQRLARRLCPDCKEFYQPTDEELREINIPRARLHNGGLWRAVGCGNCNQKGYRGRSGIYELLIVSDAIRAKVNAGSDAGAVKKLAIAEGMRTLRDDGLDKAIAGETSLDEVLRVTKEESV
jgi:general secretion pathway protein E